jgi:hypothetical protein
LVTYGIVHLLIAWIAVTGVKGNDSQDEALVAMAQTVYGEALPWVTAFGLAALTVWQVFETIWRRTPEEARLNRTFAGWDRRSAPSPTSPLGSARPGWPPLGTGRGTAAAPSATPPPSRKPFCVFDRGEMTLQLSETRYR